ncbi:hypothetical protein [Yoonia sp. BS5-3]|uniref:DUF6985 domain-containing protein n=1 Tax=Yoonia phaeophyticola TaxID=3137369 RepID=A0ABZ2V0V0_9RHOB
MTAPQMVQPTQLTVHDLVKDEQPYLGVGFTCKWDREHGLGVLMHGALCVEVGGADTAFLGWIARRHAEAR